MVLHDLPVIEPLAKVLPNLLTEGGIFIFSVPHPCFNMGEVTLNFFADEADVRRTTYIKEVNIEMKSKPNQPVSQYCFHRPLSNLLNCFFSNGLLLSRIIEPTISQLDFDLGHLDLDWKYLPEIPPALICKMII